MMKADPESAVLGCILLENISIIKASQFLVQNDFKETSNAIIWKTMSSMYDQGKAIDILTLSSQLKTSNQLDRAGGHERVVELLENVPSSANVEYYAEIVRDNSIHRKLHVASINIQKHIKTKSAEEAVELSQKEISRVARRATKTKLISIGDAMIEAHNHIVKVHDAGSKVTGLNTGFAILNKLLAGFHRKELVLVAGRPSMGKTALALSFGITAAKDGEDVLIFSLEMDAQQLGARVLSLESRVNLQRMRNASCKEEDWVKLSRATNKYNSVPLTIVNESELTISQLRTVCRDHASRNKLRMVIVDYIQLVRAPGAERREREVAEISFGLKAMAKELDVTVIGLSQLNRGLESRPNKRPNLGDLRESGSLEQDADVVMFVYRDSKYNKETTDQNMAELIIAKQRQGPCGTAKVGFNEEQTRFYDCSDETRPFRGNGETPGRTSKSPRRDYRSY